MGAHSVLAWGEPTGQGWTQIWELALALLLCTLIGLEREFKQKSAGLRTHTLVGVGAALIMLISKYGFTSVLGEHVTLDPSRVAAQIVSGIGFIGGGLIFVRRDAVRGLTTAAVVWMSAAVGMACGAGLPVLAILVTAAHFLVIYGYPAVTSRLPRSRFAPSLLWLTYHGGRGVLRRVLADCTQRGYAVSEIRTEEVTEPSRPTRDTRSTAESDRPTEDRPGQVSVRLTVQGGRNLADLAASLSELDGVTAVRAGDEDYDND